jgi:hypothetical protein
VKPVHFNLSNCFSFDNTQLKHELFIDASAMSTVHPIDEPDTKRQDSPKLGSTGTHHKDRAAKNVNTHFTERFIMNSKLLFATTLAASLASSLAMAGEAPLTRAQVVSEFNQAVSDGTLLVSDADFANAPIVAQGPALTRAEVAGEVATARANGTLLVSDADFARNTTSSPSTLTRAAVKAEVREAIATGTLLRSDSDFNRVYASSDFNGPRSL